MKQKIILTLALASAVFMLAACGDAGTKSSEASSSRPGEEETQPASGEELMPVTEETEGMQENSKDETMTTERLPDGTDEPASVPGTSEPSASSAFIPSESYAAGTVLRVAITLTDPSLSAAGYTAEQAVSDPQAIAYKEYLNRKQEDLIHRIETATSRPLEVVWQFTQNVNVISVNLPTEFLSAVSHMAGVAGIEIETVNEPQEGGAVQPGTVTTTHEDK